MAYSAACPSCGAPIEFRSAASFHAVCGFCRSTLVRHGGALDNLGRMAELLEDASPLQLGTEGVYKGVHFAVIGRIQLQYQGGLWNEWHVLFDDMRGGWLSDANGEYLISFLTAPKVPIPDFHTLVIDMPLRLAEREWSVSNIEDALCIAGEGELPFAFGAGYPAQLVDLRARDESGGFASIDYSEAPPLFFVGEALPFERFKFANLRPGHVSEKDAGPVKALQCPSCGGPISVHDKAVQSVACPSCLTVLDAANESLRILAKASAARRIEPRLALGSRGRLEGHDWTVIGFQQRVITAEGIAYPWQEYLLHHPQQGFRWLVEADGHWNFVTPLSAPPRYTDGLPTVTRGGENYTRYTAGQAVTTYVIGEFNWKVSVGETWDTLDFIAPPLMLSREKSGKEVVWSEGRHLPPADVASAFGLKTALPEPKGVGATQPNPRRESHALTCARFWKFLALATVLQLVWAFVVGNSTVLEERVAYSPQREEPVTTSTFRLTRPARSLVLRHDTDISNNWVGLHLTLVEKTSGKAWATATELSYWQGVEDGESWSEGSRDRELVFRDLPAGEYYLVVEPELSDEKRVAVADRIRIVRDSAPWSNYFILLVVLALFPIISRSTVGSFEAKRWQNADFAATGTEIGTGNDGDD